MANTPQPSPADISRFWSRVRKGGGCWEWTGSRNGKGYGQFWIGKTVRKAHRMAYFLTFGEWPSVLVLHSCDVPSCVNPQHLWTGTAKDNRLDCVRKGRAVFSNQYTKRK